MFKFLTGLFAVVVALVAVVVVYQGIVRSPAMQALQRISPQQEGR